MSKRISDEERVVEFFNTAETSKVETVFNVIRGVVKRRLSVGEPGKKTPVKKVTRKSAKSTAIVPAKPASSPASSIADL